jgi:ATP adenylyltransferase
MFQQGTLRAEVARVTAQALRSGTLQPIPTEVEFVEDAGVRFLVRVVSNLARKDQQQRAAGERADGRFNPFLPHDAAMYVTDASTTHVCLLNKFNVVDQHLLIVTREFECQEAPLNRADFAALWKCLIEFEGLGFYNAGAEAGASQPHKHLQLVPLPLVPAGPAIPTAPLIEVANVPTGDVGTGALPFVHAVARLDARLADEPEAAVAAVLSQYREMLCTLQLTPSPEHSELPTQPYNLLLTRRWLLVVPRTQERVEGVSLNALAFAGAMLVRNRQQLESVRNFGPMAALQRVTRPRSM